MRRQDFILTRLKLVPSKQYIFSIFFKPEALTRRRTDGLEPLTYGVP